MKYKDRVKKFKKESTYRTTMKVAHKEAPAERREHHRATSHLAEDWIRTQDQKQGDPQFIQEPGHGVIVDGQRGQEGLAFESSNGVLTLLRRIHQTHY